MPDYPDPTELKQASVFGADAGPAGPVHLGVTGARSREGSRPAGGRLGPLAVAAMGAGPKFLPN
jgi:hypothetical protein